LGAVSRPERRAGIEKIRAYPGSLVLDIHKLGAVRGHDPADLHDTMMIDERSINPIWEDPVTMAVNAAKPMLTDGDRQAIELLIVGTESAPDQEKAASTWVHRYLGLKPSCRNFEVKHACYSGTAGLQMALAWIVSGVARDAKALVITTDQSRMHLGQPYEFVMGASAAAILVSSNPRLLEVEVDKCGYWTEEVSDLTRPTSRVEQGDAETSLLAYLDALEGAYAHYVERVGKAIDFDTYFSKNIYHAPFGGITFRAHKSLLRKWKPLSKREAWAHFERKSLASLRYIRRMGGTYASSPLIGLMGLVDGSEGLRPGDRVSLYSYGSGCCAEFYSGLIGPTAREAVHEAGLSDLLDERHAVSVEEYEEVERERTRSIDCGDYEPGLGGLEDWYGRHYRGKGYLVFRGMRDYYRRYAWS
jgi:3-hydroxy-3-methylglutaryl CoA synthase